MLHKTQLFLVVVRFEGYKSLSLLHPPLLAYNLSIKTNVSPKNFEEEAELTNHLSEPEATQSLMNTEPAISQNAPFCRSQQGRGAIKIKH